MQDDENTLPVEEQPTEPATEEVAQEETLKADEVVALKPAEYRHFKAWEAAQRPSAPKIDTPQPPHASVEETVLLVNGMPKELMKELKVVAQVRQVSLVDAQADPIFVAVKEKFEKDQKHEAASLPASRGAGAVKVQKDYLTPNLSREEHRKMVLGS